ncbi:NfeD family protein [Loktanella sp. R86503]|uniref:NfeD family protein n=1 Tax=Loktanella sp. R86503 TaxID=3093847 RepID=UPI0036DA6B79
MLASVWWVWLSAALGLATLEVIVPGYIFLGFAIGAALVGLLLLIVPIASMPLILVIFAALSLGAYLAMRRIFGLPGQVPKIWERDIND